MPLPIGLQCLLRHSQGAGTGFLCQHTLAKFSITLNFGFRRSWAPQAQVSLQATEHVQAASRHGAVLLWAAAIPPVRLAGYLLVLWSAGKQVEKGKMNSPIM